MEKCKNCKQRLKEPGTFICGLFNCRCVIVKSCMFHSDSPFVEFVNLFVPKFTIEVEKGGEIS